jgi:hypothetical protein
MNNSRKIQPVKVYFTVAQVAFKMNVDKSHIVKMIDYFGIKPKIKKGVYKLIPAEIEIFYRIQLLRDWGQPDEEILAKRLYGDTKFLEIYNRKKAEEIKNKNKK